MHMWLSFEDHRNQKQLLSKSSHEIYSDLRYSSQMQSHDWKIHEQKPKDNLSERMAESRNKNFKQTI